MVVVGGGVSCPRRLRSSSSPCYGAGSKFAGMGLCWWMSGNGRLHHQKSNRVGRHHRQGKNSAVLVNKGNFHVLCIDVEICIL